MIGPEVISMVWVFVFIFMGFIIHLIDFSVLP